MAEAGHDEEIRDYLQQWLRDAPLAPTDTVADEPVRHEEDAVVGNRRPESARSTDPRRSSRRLQGVCAGPETISRSVASSTGSIRSARARTPAAVM